MHAVCVCARAVRFVRSLCLIFLSLLLLRYNLTLEVLHNLHCADASALVNREKIEHIRCTISKWAYKIYTRAFRERCTWPTTISVSDPIILWKCTLAKVRRYCIWLYLVVSGCICNDACGYSALYNRLGSFVTDARISQSILAPASLGWPQKSLTHISNKIRLLQPSWPKCTEINFGLCASSANESRF